jgi:hypothetical protein
VNRMTVAALLCYVAGSVLFVVGSLLMLLQELTRE